ncbi:MAG: isoaspartyl peptidase/L-asparaginase [Pseudomonadota bacterium]
MAFQVDTQIWRRVFSHLSSGRLWGLTAACALVVSSFATEASADQSAAADDPDGSPPLTILVHGGAGALEKGRYTAEQEVAFKNDLKEALRLGYGQLADGGTALDAVVAAVTFLEDSPLFNAGKGAVFTRDGQNELDASIMDGRDKNAGAVAGTTRVKNPILLARAVMENSEHVMMIGKGAEKFADEQSLEFVPKDYFKTEARWQVYKERLAAEKSRRGSNSQDDEADLTNYDKKQDKYGTVGAVALDSAGNLAAATSTGGMMMKRYGRVGDVPIIGAGVYADNNSCAVSSTGWGEYFIRLTVAREICAQVEYTGKSVVEAADDVINNRLEKSGGDGGVIVLGPDGSHTMTFNSKGMFRGVLTVDAEPEVAIYGE